MVISQRGRLRGAQTLRRFPRFVEEALALDFRLVRRLAEESAALFIKHFVLVLKVVALLLCLGLLRIGIRKFSGDALFPCVDGVEDGLVEEMLQQPHQDEEVQYLCPDGEPVDEHGSFPSGLSDDVTPKRIRENENHRDDKTVDGQ